MWCLLLTLLFASPLVLAQARAPLPTLTTDDVVGARPTTPAPAVPAKEDSKKVSPADKSAVKEVASSAPAKATDDARKQAEKDWNERLKKAQATVSELERRADQTELQITQLRNQLFSATARGPEVNSQLTTRINELSALRNRLRAQAQLAQLDVAGLEAEGQRNAYQNSEAPLTNEKGEPDAQAFRAEYDKLQSELRDAQARVEVLQFRLNRAQAEVLKRGNGDNFALNRLRQERDQVTTELQETRTRIEDVKNKLQAHQQKAAAAGVPLGSQ
jgi:chromosome segregation ATPase